MVAIESKPNTRIEQRLTLQGVSWDFYNRLLKETEEDHFFITYAHGDLEIMSPLAFHEMSKGLFSQLITILCMTRQIDFVSGGNTTFRRKDLKVGLEPDDCYWIANALRVNGLQNYDISKDPPPDLAIEMESTRSVLKRIPIYAALGVPEVWRYDGKALRILILKRGVYKASKSSKCSRFCPWMGLSHFCAGLAMNLQLCG